MHNPVRIVSEFVLEQLSSVPVERRIQVTRALGELTVNPKEKANLLSLANLLEDVERNHLQLVLDFKNRRK